MHKHIIKQTKKTKVQNHLCKDSHSKVDTDSSQAYVRTHTLCPKEPSKIVCICV